MQKAVVRSLSIGLACGSFLGFAFQANAQVFPALNGSVIESCSGTFHDSGGPGGNYSNNEAITTTICPAGGPGSGPLTQVRFSEWALAPGPGDTLRVFAGTVATGTPLLVAVAATSMVGQVFTASLPDGCLTFRWSSSSAGVAAGWSAQILTGPDAGQDASLSLCSSDLQQDLFNALAGDPDAGGVWTDPNGLPFDGSFTPGADAAGTYTYTVSGPIPCPSASATVTVVVNPARNPGTNASITVCSSAAPFSMRSRLGGAPEPGGVWTDPNGQPRTSAFDPSVDAAGTYTYTLTGLSPCPDRSAQLTIAIVNAPSAGGNASITLCSNGPVVDLFAQLSGTPQSGGTWTGPNGSHSGLFDPATDTPGPYSYTVQGTTPCAPATATVQVSVNVAPNAGTPASLSVCSNFLPQDLVLSLGGSPDPGGSWTGPGGGAVTGIYVPGASTPGVYTYTVLGLPPCPAASAAVTVQQVQAPVAGSSAAITVCSSEGPFTMVDRLGGGPALNGSWVGPSGPHGSQFDPGSDAPGTYVYTVQGIAPCANASATLTIAVNRQPVAGSDAVVTVCSTDADLLLWDELGGTPDPGGIWTDPNGQLHPGVFQPQSSLPGIYTYTVSGLSPCSTSSATVTVSENRAPVAGVNGASSFCSSDGVIALAGLLGGTPDAGGAWTGPQGAHGDVFAPGTDPAGLYTYTVPGIAPCANASAVVNITVVRAPDAGSDALVTVCSNGVLVDLLEALNGTPEGGGTWTNPSGGAHGTSFIPGTDLPGAYRYRVPGQAPCVDAEAFVTVSVVQAPNPGTNGTLSVCSDAGPVDLFSLLGGFPQAGGTWTRPSGSAHSGIYQPASEPGGTYSYTVQGTAPCTALSASVQVVRVIAPNAGVNSSTTVCSSNSAFELLAVLGGNPNGNGQWLAPGGGSSSGNFVPGTSLAGVYTYVVPGTAPCVNDTALLNVVVNQAPNAGANASITLCSTDAPVDLVTRLGGNPNSGGTWTGPDGPFSGTYTPGSSTPGGYTYVVNGVAPCPNASSVLVVNENRQPLAGNNAILQRCSTDPPVDLFSLLGTADPGGGWTGPDGPMSGIFLPASSPSGAYVYALAAQAPCISVSSTVSALVDQAPNAGISGSISVCTDQSVVDLFDGLDGTPDPNGTWTDLSATGQQSGQFFSPLNLPAGSYQFRYTVPGSGPCGAAEATVTVNVVGLLDAGSNGTISVCQSNTQVNLFTGLGGSPQAGGQWLDLSGTGAQTNQFFNASLVGPGTYTFRYRLTGTVSCASDSATATVNVVAAPRAGTPGTASTCSNGPAFNLFPSLGGNPQGGGTWTQQGGQPFSGVYDPLLNSSGVFTYTVAGSAPCTSVSATVTVTEVQAPNAGLPNTLTICSSDGPVNMAQQLGGTPQSGGAWTFGGQPHANNFVPGLDQGGIYVYTVTGQAPCNPAQATLTITQQPAPNAGNNASITLCSNSAPVVLNSLLGPSAQAGGSWVGPDGPSNGVYIPGTSQPGAYFYTVNGLAPCAPDVAVVSVFENSAPNAGTSAAITLCAGGANVSLLNVLGGTPDPTGTWVGPAPVNQPFSGTFVPGTTPAGTYTYTVLGAPPCLSLSSTVNVAVNAPAFAGCSNAISVCSNSTGFAMVDRLACAPSSLQGTWVGPGNVPSNGLFIPGVTTPGVYTYTVQGNAPCVNSSATLTISVTQAANAGNNASISLCSTGGAAALFPLLGPNAQLGGTWTNPSGAVHSGTFLPNVDEPGTYRYTIPAQGSCASAFALVTVVLNQAPNAGCNGVVTVCNDAAPFTLFNRLGCAPSSGGSWTGPSGQTHSGIFVPGTSIPGVYTYTVNGTAPCNNATAQVTVIQNNAPNAGTNAILTVCTDQPPVDLFTVLGGSPQPGGSWRAPDGSAFSGTLVPSSSQPGVYTYRVGALAPCVADSATVTVIRNVAPVAGISTVVSVCSNTPPFPLVDLLGGTLNLNGTWRFGGAPRSPVFDPAVDGSGTYVYTVNGQAPCSNASAQVQIVRVAAPLAGTGGTLSACVDDPAIALVQGLAGTFNTGGTWSDEDATGQLSGAVFNSTGLAAGSYRFTYTVQGAPPCSAASTTVTVNISEALYAGDDFTLQICESEIVDLFPQLGPLAQLGGVWQDVDGSGALVGAGVFNATLVSDDTSWRFRYILAASAQCPGDTAFIQVNVLDGPFAGCDGAFSLCTTNAPVSLINALTCGPDGGGTWIGPNGNAHSGTFLPALDTQGVYRYVVAGVGACPADTARVTVQVAQAANPGVGTNISICSSDSPVNLFAQLGPNAQTGGTWTVNGAPHSGIYNPAINNPGAYIYTIAVPPPCGNVSATVNVAEPQAPNAGCNASVTLCSSQVPINMRLALGCAPQAGGTWVGPNGPHGTFFDPASDTPGLYVYTVAGTSPCADATASLLVDVTQAAFPGQGTSLSACLGQTAVDLFQALGPLAQPGGTWTEVTGSGALSGSVFNPALAGVGPWTFTYGFAANGPCPAQSATVTVNVITGPNAGSDNTVTVCGANAAINLFQLLGGTPNAGGTWTDQLGTGGLLPGGVLNATLLPEGTTAPFSYTVTDPTCGSVSATVLLTVAAFPDPGVGADLRLCVNSEEVDLFAQLLGTPSNSGVWIAPSGLPHGPVFRPGIDPPGNYRYTVAGNTACPDSSAVVGIVVDQPANPGIGGSLVVCDTLPAFNLFSGLSGTPAPGGLWTSTQLPGNNFAAGTLDTRPLNAGAFIFTYTVGNPGCGDASAQVVLNVVDGVRVVDVQRTCDPVARTYVVSFVIEGGDPSSYAVSGLQGTISSTLPWVFTSRPLYTSEGFLAFVTDANGCAVRVVEGNSPCQFEDAVFIPQSFSPNGDGINDAFIIPGIEGFPTNSIRIFNRWGARMFEASGYDNRTVVWNGASSDGAYAGSAPSGTYYYVLDLGNGGQPLTGYIYLNR